jgi:hypothetical protein
MNVPTSKQHSNSRSWLVGVPKKKAPDFWWKIFFWPKTIGSHKVPEHFMSAGMYCPKCGNGQPVFEWCAFCGCAFSCFIVIETRTVFSKRLKYNGTVSPARVPQGRSYGLLTPLRAFMVRIGKGSLQARVMAVCVMLLLLISLVIGIVHHRSQVRRQYAHNYVQALYIIKSGMHLDEMICDGTYNAWRGVESSDVPEYGGIAPQALADLEAVKAKIDKIMGEMGTPSVEYDKAAQILLKIYSIYDKTNSMVITSQDSLSQHEAEMIAARNEFSLEIDNLKVNMPAPLMEEVKIASKKYDLGF